MVGRKLPFPASDRAIHTRPSLHITLADNSFPWRHFLLPPRTADYWKHVKVRRMAIVLQNLDRLQESLGMLQEWLQCLRSTKKIPEGSVLNFVPSHMTSIKAWSLAGSSDQAFDADLRSKKWRRMNQRSRASEFLGLRLLLTINCWYI